MLIVKSFAGKPTNARYISLTRGLFTLVDADLFDWLNQRKWRAQKSASSTYAICRIKKHGKVKTVRMHRLIMDAPLWMKVHHINHDSLDNRRENLSVITEREHRHFDGWHIFSAKKEGIPAIQC